MARMRTIKPEFFTSEVVAELSLRARMTWIGLWTHCDDEGRCKDNSRLIHAALYPLDEHVTADDVAADLDELARNDRIVRYVVDGRHYVQVTNWNEHQKPNRPQGSKLPPPDDGEIREPAAHEPDVNAHCGITEDSVNAHETRTAGAGEQGSRGAGEQGSDDSSLAAARSTSDRFEEFWTHYPRKDNKAAARKAWRKTSKRFGPDQLIAEIQRWSGLWANAGTERQFIPHASTWLNGERWTDEPPPPRLRAVSGGHQPWTNPTDPSAYEGEL